MARFFVTGLINVETTLAVDNFPIEYSPDNYPFFGVQTTVSGVGFNIAKALTTLGSQVELASLIGAGDALFSAFLDNYLRSGDPYVSLKAAMAFASYKIGEKGAAQGFLNGENLDAWVRKSGS